MPFAPRAELKRALPLALVLAAALGTVLAVGANLSNAFPSEARPFGWPGPSSFENGVAMVRPDLVLAASLPALALGALALRGRDARADGAGTLARVFAFDAALLTIACFAAGFVASFWTAKAPADAIVAFGAAHAILALSFYALAFFCAAALRRHAMAAAVGVWLFFQGVYESLTRVILFRQVGYEPLHAGHFPSWFYVSQVFSPLSAYRGVLILWRHGFMDYVEKAALGNATLPGWMNPGTFAALALGLWILLPLGLAALVWWWRAARAPRPGAATLIDAT